MKNINPIYILVIVLSLLVYVYVDTFLTKKEIEKKSFESETLQTQISEITELKKEYGNAEKNKREFVRMFSSANMEKFVKSKEITNTAGTLFLQGIEERESKQFLQKLFNSNLKIKSCEIKKSTEYSLDIKAEVLF